MDHLFGLETLFC